MGGGREEIDIKGEHFHQMEKPVRAWSLSLSLFEIVSGSLRMNDVQGQRQRQSVCVFNVAFNNYFIFLLLFLVRLF